MNQPTSDTETQPYKVGDRVAHADPDHQDEFLGTVVGVSDDYLTVRWDTWVGHWDQVQPSDPVAPMSNLARAAAALSAAGWAAWEADDEENISQDGLGLLDWAAHLLAGEMTDELWAKMAPQLRDLADRIEGIDEP